MPLHLTVNDRPVVLDVAPKTRLAELLRGRLALTSTRVACDTGQCGACTVLVDGRAVRSCSTLALQVQGCAVTTVEGLTRDGALHPVTEALMACHALRCGFCRPGVTMTAVGLLAQQPNPSEAEIVRALQSSPCRCTGVANIVGAVQQAARAMAAGGAGGA